MINTSKNILRGILVLSYIAVTVVVIFGLSGLISYLNTGADRSNMLHTEIKKIDQYLPKLEWEPLKNEGRPMDLQTLKAIESDYLDAWYVKHVAFKTNTLQGIDDYYTEHARKPIYNIVNRHAIENISVDATTLEHHISLEFFSEDGQLAVLRDSDVLEYKRLYQKDKMHFETKERSTYKVILLLEDGFWRIRHLIKEHSVPYKKAATSIPNTISNIKGINYYPQATPRNMYGDAFDSNIISEDFKIIKGAGLNSIRIFVPYEAFGKASVKEDKLEKLKTVLDIAQKNQLKVIVTLFDFYGDYEVLDWTLNQHHATKIVSALKHHKALLAWDIKNEPNLDFDSRGKTKVMAWLKHMVTEVKLIDDKHPVTIGWSDAEHATLLNEDVDFVSFHYYEDLKHLGQTYATLKKTMPNKDIVLTEYGLSSNRGVWNPLGYSEKDQADYHEEAQTIFTKNNIQFMSWTLYDFPKIPKEVVGRLPWRKQTQEHFGFIDQNGETKPAFKFIVD
jgi:hypothetical protein